MFLKWIGWKNYEVLKNCNLESVSAKIKLIFSHQSAILPARVPACGPTSRIASRFLLCASPPASLGKTALLTGKTEEGYAGGGRPPAHQTTATAGRWWRAERGVRGIDSPPHLWGRGDTWECAHGGGYSPRGRPWRGPWEWKLERCQPMQARDDDLRVEQLQVKLECRR
jgi:hypothetical protein